MAGEVKIIKGIAAAAALAAALALCLLLAQDTEPPQVTTKTVTVRHYEDGVDTDGARTEPYSAADFIDTYTDNRKGKAFTVQYGEGYLDFQEPGKKSKHCGKYNLGIIVHRNLFCIGNKYHILRCVFNYPI